MAQDAQLLLKVGLDLTAFRNSLATLGQAAAGYNLPIKVKFDRSSITSELTKLGNQLGRKKYRIDITDVSLEVATKKVDTLAAKLKDLSAKIDVSVNTGGGRSFSQTAQGAAGLAEYMRSQGLSGGGGFAGLGRSARLQQALGDLTVKQLQSLAKQEGIAGVSKLRKDPLINKLLSDLSQQAMERILGNAKMMLQSPFPNVATTGVSGRTLGARVSGQMPMGSGLPMLPAAGQTAALSMGTLSSNLRQPSMPSTGMMGPASSLGRGYDAYTAALNVATASMKQFRASQIPLIGGLKEIGGEFLMATKQVLLYGTAYKGLAFVTSLPGQILNAARSQQQYNNALQTATQDTGTFAKELLYVDNVQRAFGLNLETTRTGFVRLYASMAPTGFDSGSIEKLFTGISAATAALQLTPDRAERVIYAFGQMASKGQIMSEELKGQLGDVLPGALALFAKAAGMSVKEFSKAMEDGVFVGGKFREVFAKVSDELMNRFGTGAQAAGRSLQGLLNTVQGDFQRTLESFSPLANVAAQSILGPLSAALKQLSMAAQVAMGEQQRVAKQLADAKATNANAQSIAALEARLRGLQEAAKDPAIAQQAKNIQSFVVEIGKAGNAVMNAAQAIGSVLNPLLTFLGTNLSTVATLLMSFAAGFVAVRLAITTAMAVLTLFNVAVKSLAAGAVGVNALSAAFRVLGVSAGAAQIGVVGLGTAMKVLLFSSGLGIAVGLLTAIATAAMGMGSAMRQAAQEARQAMQEMAQAAIAGNAALIQMRAATYKANISTLQAMKSEITKGGGRKIGKGGRTATVYDVNPIQRQILEAVPGVDLPQGPITSKQFSKALNDAEYMQKVGLQAATKFEQIAKTNEAKFGLNKPQPMPMAPEVAAVGGKPKGGGAKTRESRLPLLNEELSLAKQLFAIDQQIFQARLVNNELSVIRLEGEKEQLRIASEIARVRLEKDVPVAEQLRQIEKLRLDAEARRMETSVKIQQEIQKELESVKKSMADAALAAANELEDRKSYERLVREGLAPALAQITVEVNRQFATEIARLDILKQQIEGQIKTLQIELDKTTNAEKRLEIEREIAKLQGTLASTTGAIAGAPALAQATIGSRTEKQSLENRPKMGVEAIQESYDATKKKLAELRDLGFQVSEGGKVIGGAFGQAFKDIASGSVTAQEALANMMQSIASHFLEMAAQIIAQQITMMIYGTILKALGIGMGAMGGGLSGGGALTPGAGAQAALPTSYAGVTGATSGLGSFGAGGGFGGFSMFGFAEGGYVNGPTSALIGEGGEPEYVIPASKMQSAMARYGAGARGAAVIPAEGGGDGGEMGGASLGSPLTIDLRYSVERINSVDYVTADQFERGMARAAQQGARQGEQLTLRRLQQSRSTRSRLGMN